MPDKATTFQLIDESKLRVMLHMRRNDADLEMVATSLEGTEQTLRLTIGEMGAIIDWLMPRREAKRIDMLEHIAYEVSNMNPAAKFIENACPFCSVNGDAGDIEHTRNCIVTQARALFAYPA
jgi:hypothetical protein